MRLCERALHKFVNEPYTNGAFPQKRRKNLCLLTILSNSLNPFKQAQPPRPYALDSKTKPVLSSIRNLSFCVLKCVSFVPPIKRKPVDLDPASVLPYVAVCCRVLQCAAVCCSVMQGVAICCDVLQRVAACCREPTRRCKGTIVATLQTCVQILRYTTLQHTATHCNTPQHTATYIYIYTCVYIQI